MFKKILLLLVVLLAGFLLVVALKSPSFHIARSITISAPPAAIFPQVNNLHEVNAWSPWLPLDPAVRMTYAGPGSGVGASSSWVGNSQVGEGTQTIIESRPNESVKLRLDFRKPFESSCNAEYTLAPKGDQTVVTWSMSGENNFIGRMFCMFMDQDKMIGGSFETGLASLKARTEAKPKG